MEPWRVCTPVVVDFHQFDDEQDPDPVIVKARNQIGFNVKRILNADPDPLVH
jgi:hypothetical protein